MAAKEADFYADQCQRQFSTWCESTFACIKEENLRDIPQGLDTLRTIKPFPSHQNMKRSTVSDSLIKGWTHLRTITPLVLSRQDTCGFSTALTTNLPCSQSELGLFCRISIRPTAIKLQHYACTTPLRSAEFKPGCIVCGLKQGVVLQL